MKDSTMLIFVFGLVVIVALALPSVFDTGSAFLSGIMDFVKSGFQNMGGSGTASLSINVCYADGSNQTFRPDPNSLLPLLISDTGGEVTRLEIGVLVQMSYEGTINQWSCESLLVVSIKQGTATKVGQFKNWLIEASGTSWTQLSKKQIGAKTITAQELETATEPHGEGTYNLVLIFDLTMTVQFTDGTTESKGASAVPATWTYAYSTSPRDPAGAIKSLNVQIGIGQLRP